MSTPDPPRASARVVLVATVVLGLTLFAVVADTRRVRTGELLVQSDRADLRVTVTRGGRPVAGPTGKRSFTLLPGDYDIEADGRTVGRVSVVRGGRSVLSVAGSTEPQTKNSPKEPAGP